MVGRIDDGVSGLLHDATLDKLKSNPMVTWGHKAYLINYLLLLRKGLERLRLLDKALHPVVVSLLGIGSAHVAHLALGN